MVDAQSERTFVIHGSTDAFKDDRKTFEVHKRFEVHDAKPDSSELKTFKPEGSRHWTTIPGTDREVLFTRQLNAYDCGPSMVLNVLQALQVESELDDVQSVREANNKRRILTNTGLKQRNPTWGVDNPTLLENGWFTSIDVDGVLREEGLEVFTSIVDMPEDKASLLDRINKLQQGNADFVVYTGNDRHYRAIYQPIGGQEVMLDSLAEDISIVDNGISGMVEAASCSDRIESIGIALVGSSKEVS
jgi:hypothetical protein